MSPARIHISKRTAEAAAEALEVRDLVAGSANARALSELRGALRSLAGRAKNAEVKQALPKSDRRAEQRARKRTKREETAEIREFCMERAGGRCELPSCCMPFTDFNPAEMDHFFGRGKVKQSFANCWMLCRACHRVKTRAIDLVEGWRLGFIQHAERYRYDHEAEEARRGLVKMRDRAALSAALKEGEEAEREFTKRNRALAVKAEEVGRG